MYAATETLMLPSRIFCRAIIPFMKSSLSWFQLRQIGESSVYGSAD
jgi:hypothetical protein